MVFVLDLETRDYSLERWPNIDILKGWFLKKDMHIPKGKLLFNISDQVKSVE